MTKCVPSYWGRSTWKRVQEERIPDKVAELLIQKLLAQGTPALLYMPVTDGLICTCVKETSKTNDRPCNECYGTGFVPGYNLFLHETVYFGVSEASGYTFTNCAVSYEFKPNVIFMTNGTTTATIITPDKPYVNPNNDDWAINLDAYERAAGSAVTAEFSTDSGATWFSTGLINGVNKPVGSGLLRFRITMTRAAAADRSPGFQIIRARHVNSANYNVEDITNIRGNVQAGQILVLRPWVNEQARGDVGRGVTAEWTNDASWTAPLSFFDLSIASNTPEDVIRDTEPGPHPFIEYGLGIKTGERSVLTLVKFNEEFGTLTQQSFNSRRAQDKEAPYALVW